MTELYEDPARAKQMINRTLNTDVKINPNSLLLVPIYLQLCDLIKHEISMEHVNIINNTWYYYQVLIKMSSKIGFKKIKKKINKLISLQDEILQEMLDQDISLFEQSGRPFALFGTRNDIIQFSKNLNRKNGSPYSTNSLIRQCYFELLFIAESLGLVSPNQYYQRSELKSFLEIVTTPLIESSEPTDKTLEYYCQEYDRAKNHSNVKKLISELIKHCIEYRLNAALWEKLLTIYQIQIAPLMLTQ
ncbi:hypothetical protein [Legionella maceachernii]|uniref:Uncharacterized protein n=1 Tax=Legionella maceachernii TaxID=466 RepID=A0A0W0VWU3_9GAMM|nr:hypothetical protein [Legionella maceachernii]KTD24118.1 hypothetical protein Lmac_2991 [Legionella maceachernii]SJZ86521.1 hypothetical protein SAMN02745128_01286 [Legionella maceachernii]SUO99036.1 Uncharacterised protein [Legionella maceachernii]